MANKITYNDKAPFQNDPDIPDDNKVLAKNMNEIKTVVNANADELNKANQNIENLQSGQGTSNADITSLKNRVSTLETDNTTNKSNITNLQSNKVDKVEGKGLSTEDFTTELKSKLESLENYDDTEIKEDISNLEAEQIEQNEQIDILLNALPSETAEDENINIKGTIPTKFKEFVVGGNSKQETRSGKNMINVLKNTLTTNGITFTNNRDGSVTINGTATGTAFFSMQEQTFTIENGKTYSLYLGGTTNGLNMAVRRASINTQLFILSNAQEAITTTYNGETVDDAYAYIRVETGTTLNNVTVYPMLVESSEIGDYEPYGAMPSPEFPSEIQNVEGDVNVTVCNKNIANPEEVWNNMQAYNSSYCSEVVEDGKECIRFATSFFRPDVKNPFNLIDYKYKENTQYTIRMLVKKDSTQGSERLFLQIIYTDGTYELKYVESSNWIELKIVSNSQKTIDKIGFSYNTNTYYFLDKSSLFIAEGDTTDYVEHQEQTVLFPLAQGQKLMLGDYLAADGIHHVRKQIELDGTDFSLYSNQVAGRTIYMISAFSNNNNFKTYDSSILCNILKQGTSSNGNNYLNNNGSSGSLYVSIENSILGITDESTNEEKLQAFQNLIAETGFVYEGELAEEETEAYTEEQQEAYNQICNLKAYEEETNVYSTNSTSPIFKVTAVKDINSVITELNTVLLERS